MSKKKINSLILRLGIKKKWLSKYFEKKQNELKFYIYQDLQIQQFIKIFLLKFGLKLVHLEFYYQKFSLTLFLVYTIDMQKFKNLINKENLKFKKHCYMTTNFWKKSCLTLDLNKLINYKLKIKFLKIKKISTFFSHYLYRICKKIKLYKNIKKFELFFKKNQNGAARFFFIKYLNLIQKNKKNNVINKFLSKIFVSLNNFLNKKITVILIIKQLNKLPLLTKQQKLTLSFNILNLRKFESINNFKSSTNLLYNVFNNKKQTMNLISTFISNQLSKIKNPKFFNFYFKFALNAIKYLLLFSKKFKGIVIEIKGNLSKNPRALKKTVKLGMPITKNLINNELDYCQTTSFSKKGTIGVKIWLKL